MKLPTKKKDEVLAVRDAADWHKRIADELEDPVLPQDPATGLLREIEAQRDRHKLFAKALETLAKKAD